MHLRISIVLQRTFYCQTNVLQIAVQFRAWGQGGAKASLDCETWYFVLNFLVEKCFSLSSEVGKIWNFTTASYPGKKLSTHMSSSCWRYLITPSISVRWAKVFSTLRSSVLPRNSVKRQKWYFSQSWSDRDAVVLEPNFTLFIVNFCRCWMSEHIDMF